MQAHDRLPETIGGYRILRRLAREATVDVLLARGEGALGGGPGGGPIVVLKMVTPTFRGDAMFEQTFAHETQAIAQLDHPCVVRLFDVFSGPDVKAMVLEHVDGLTVSELRAALIRRSETLPDAAIYTIAAALFSALAAAHAARDPQTGNLLPIVHRDVHPGQVLVTRDGSVKLGGFGLERITGVRGDARSGEARGYLPPEKARGESVTIRSDVYAAMLLVWELLARRRAVRDDALPEQELLRALAQPSIVSLEVLRPELPSLVRSVISRGLEPHVERRAVTAEEAASIFRSAVGAQEGHDLLAQAMGRVLDGAAATVATDADAPLLAGQGPSVSEPSLPRFPLGSSPSSPGLTPSPGETDKRGGPPRPNPRRVWASSPTLTPVPAEIPPSSRGGSIPDARFSQEPNRDGSRSDEQASRDLAALVLGGAEAPASAAKPSSSRTVAGGFDVSSLQPLLQTPPPSRAEPAGQAAPAAWTPAVPAPQAAAIPPMVIPTPGQPLPGMAVPLAMAQAQLADVAPMPPAVDAPIPPPASAGMSGFWSAPPPPPNPTAPTVRHGRRERSWAALGVGLFFVATSVGAGGFVWLFRRSAAHTPTTMASTTIGSVRATASSIGLAPAPPVTASNVLMAPASAAPAPHASSVPSSALASATASASPSVAPTPSAIAASTSANAPVADAATQPIATSATGLVYIDKRAAGHRVFVDGRVVGEGEGPFSTPCGRRTIKVGSRGRTQTIEVPCGSEITVSK